MGRYRAYPTYKDSDVAWLGKIPTNWSITPLKHLTTRIGRGQSPVYADEETTIQVVNQACIHWSGLRFENVKYHQTGFNINKGRLEGNDVLINSTGTGTLGRVYVFPRNNPGVYVADSHITVVRTIESLCSPQFLHFLLATTIYQGFIYTSLTSGATNQVELSRKGLAFMPCVVPNFDEQEKIVAFLEHETSNIDALIAKQRRLIELLQEKRQAVISYAVTKGLDLNVLMKDSRVEWLGKVPEHWTITPLRYLCRTTKVVPLSHKCFQMRASQS